MELTEFDSLSDDDFETVARWLSTNNPSGWRCLQALARYGEDTTSLIVLSAIDAVERMPSIDELRERYG